MVEILKPIHKIRTKEELLWDEKNVDAWSVGQSISFLKKKDPTTKFGVYVSDFDSLKPSDCVFLQLCRSSCDLLIVLIGSDYSIRLRKKFCQFSTKERVFRVGSLSSVNYIVDYDEESCDLAINMISPDFIFYGRTKNDKDQYNGLISKEKLTLIDYPWREERAEGKFFNL